jgi:hypothetical protein
MDVAGALQVFQNSLDRNVHYVKYLWDGDGNGFLKVVDSKPYGDEKTIQKLECVNHVKKRMGSRLRVLKKSYGKTKLEDGKTMGGKKRLTNVQIDKQQEYYGLAIRRGGDDVNEMKRNVWAIFFHKLSTDDEPQHNLLALLHLNPGAGITKHKQIMLHTNIKIAYPMTLCWQLKIYSKTWLILISRKSVFIKNTKSK